jgi:hypothetical protein
MPFFSSRFLVRSTEYLVRTTGTQSNQSRKSETINDYGTVVRSTYYLMNESELKTENNNSAIEEEKIKD